MSINTARGNKYGVHECKEIYKAQGKFLCSQINSILDMGKLYFLHDMNLLVSHIWHKMAYKQNIVEHTFLPSALQEHRLGPRRIILQRN